MAQAPERAFQPFKHFELRGWRNVAERYDSAFGSATGYDIAPANDVTWVVRTSAAPGYPTVLHKVAR